MTVTFKGQLVTKNFIVKYAMITLLFAVAFFALYYFKLYDILFQYLTFVMAGPVSLMMLLIPPLLLSTYLAFILTTINLPKQITIALTDDNFKIEYGKRKISLALKEITHVLFVKRNKNWDRITIKINKNMHINIGTIFSGVEIPEIEHFLIELKNILTKRYQLYFEENNAVKNSFSYTLSKVEPSKLRKKLWLKIGVFLVVFFGALIGTIAIILSKHDGENLPHAEGIGSSVFVSDNGKVYALKVGDGYFELKDADIKTFKPFVFGNEHGALVGRDKMNVYASDQKIVGIDIKTAEYLGLSFIKDATNVFFRTLKIPGADVATFKSLKHSAGFNTLGFKYATDKNKVYYRNNVVKEANPKTVSSVNETVDYLKDDKNAFYRTQLLPNVNAKNFYAVKINYQLFFASDGKKHFVNGKVFPAVVSNKIWGTTTVDTSQLILLQPAMASTRHLLFSDGKAIYYYNDQQQNFICADNLPKLKPYQNGGFTDGKYYYFTQSINLTSRKIGSYGSQTNIYKTNMEFANSTYKEKLAKADLILKIKTRKRTNFENEND